MSTAREKLRQALSLLPDVKLAGLINSILCGDKPPEITSKLAMEALLIELVRRATKISINPSLAPLTAPSDPSEWPDI